MSPRWERLEHNWVYGGLLAAPVLVVLLFAIGHEWAVWQVCAWLALPVYMLHQYEEHDGDRFRLFVNDALCDGREALSWLDVWVINVVFVWFLLAITTTLAFRVDPDFALVGAYLLLINGVAHVGMVAALRRSNPGVWTGVLLFIPLGAATIWALRDAGAASALGHTLACATVVALHAGIVVRARLRLRSESARDA
ncbi:MAG: HXXEE domain-containing protein [Planctomycetota bacterium]